jgi:hypothetical protein
VTRAFERIVAMIAAAADKIVDANLGRFEPPIESILLPTIT